MKKNQLNEDARMWQMQHRLLEYKQDYQIHHGSYTEAMEEAMKLIKKRGFTVDEDEWFNKVNTGLRKPAAGKTNSLHLCLEKNGKEQKKMAHIQVYNIGSQRGNPFELNMYIQ